jgi:hypothetical protein
MPPRIPAPAATASVASCGLPVPFVPRGSAPVDEKAA